jgi:uncharacterized protein
MFSLLMSRVFERIATGNETRAGLTENHALVRFFRDPGNLENALLLDDSLFWGSLHLFQEAEDEDIKNVADRIAARRFYPMLDVWRLADDVAAGNSAVKAMKAGQRVKVLNQVCTEVSEYLQKQGSLWTEGCYYDRYPREIYKQRNIDGGHS